MPLPLVLHFASRALRISNCKRSVSGFGHLLIYDGERFRVAAVHAAPSILTDFLNRGPFSAGAATGLGSLASTKRMVPQARAHDGRRCDGDERARERLGIHGPAAGRRDTLAKPQTVPRLGPALQKVT